MQRILEQRLENDPKCPHCGSRRSKAGAARGTACRAAAALIANAPSILCPARRWRPAQEGALARFSLVGIEEVGEIFLLESFKGQRKLPRAARKRGRIAEKPGLSAEQIPILIARNRAGAHIDAVLPDRSEAAVRPVLESKLSKDDALLCMDGDKALISFAETEGIEYELIIASKGEHLHEKVLHIQRSMLMAGASSNGSTASTASPPNTCQATSAGGAG